MRVHGLGPSFICKLTLFHSGPTETPATTTQMAKDVATFLNWAAEPEFDERKRLGLKAVILFSALTAISLYVKRFKWSVIKNRKICKFRFVPA